MEPTDDSQFRGCTALVVGAHGGFGQAIATTLASAGAQDLGMDLNPPTQGAAKDSWIEPHRV